MTRFNLVNASLNPILYNFYRRYLYLRYTNTDVLSQEEVIHEVAKKHLIYLSNSLKKYSHYFQHDNLLEITINNSKFSNPVGLASGFDKNCELLKPNSYIFGLVTAGTILRNINYGNKQDPKNNIKRLIINNNDKSILNSQGYPSKGLDYCLELLKDYSKYKNNKSKLILSFSGVSEDETIDSLIDNSKEIIQKTHNFVDGYEDSRSSPNTKFNKKIQTIDITNNIIDLLNSHAPNKLKILKISPYSTLTPTMEESNNKSNIIKTFYERGGDAIVINNSLSIDVQSRNIDNFNNQYGGLSGNPLFPYTEKLVKNIHQIMPKLPIIACGGINDGENAWKLINCGASMIELYSALTFQGLSVVLDINKKIKKKLNNQSLQSFIDSRDSKFN